MPCNGDVFGADGVEVGGSSGKNALHECSQVTDQEGRNVLKPGPQVPLHGISHVLDNNYST